MAIGPLPPVISEIQANSGQPGKTLGRNPAASAPADASAEVAPPATVAILPETSLIEKAVADALGRQGSLAPLYATLTELAEADGLPEAIKAAISRVLAFQIGDGEATPQRIAEAIRSSGLFHEAVASGKMSAVLTPAVRQALGRTTESPQAVPTRSDTPAAVPRLTGAAPAPTPPAPTPTTDRAMAAAIASYSRSAPMSPAPGAAGQPVASQAPASPLADILSPEPGRVAAAGGAPSSSTPPATPSSLPAQLPGAAPLVAPTTGSTPPAGTIPTGTTPTDATVTTAVASPVSVTAAAPLASGTPQSGIPSQPAPTSGPSAATPAPGSVPAAPAGLPTPAAPASTGTTAALAAPAAQSGVTAPPAGGPAAAAGPATETPAVDTVVRPAGSSAPPASAERTFTPWTPGRPMPTAQPVASAPVPGVARPTVATPSPAADATTPKPAGERAPFVPSSLDSLPNPSPLRPPVATQPGVVTTPAGTAAATPGAPLPAGQGAVPTAGTQPGTLPMAPAASAAAVSGPASGSPAGPSTGTVAATSDAGVTLPSATGPQQPTASSPPTSPTGASDRPPAPGAPSPAPGEIARPAPLPLPPIAGLDLKGALDGLRRELIHWLGRSSDVMASLDGDDSPATRADRPPPPRRGGPLRGQPAVKLSADEADAASTETLAGRALGETERSLARVFLHQAATADGRDTRPGQTTQALVMEIPLIGPNGTSVAQLRIERDDRAPTEPGAPPRRVFQVDIAFDIAPLGPVAVRIGLMDGRRVAVGVWCESDDGLVRMEQELSNIALGLEAEGMSVAGIDLHKGHPPDERDEAVTVTRNHRLDLQL